MKTINQYFEISDNAKYELVSETYCRILGPGVLKAYSGGTAVAHNGGTAEAHNGGRSVAHSGGTAEAYNGGRSVAYSGGTAVAHNGGRVCKLFEIVSDGEYMLRMSDDGYYYAGCQKNLNKDQALAHWDRDDDRALLFTFAIMFCGV